MLRTGAWRTVTVKLVFLLRLLLVSVTVRVIFTGPFTFGSAVRRRTRLGILTPLGGVMLMLPFFTIAWSEETAVTVRLGATWFRLFTLMETSILLPAGTVCPWTELTVGA